MVPELTPLVAARVWFCPPRQSNNRIVPRQIYGSAPFKTRSRVRV